MEISANKPVLLCVDANQTYLHFRKLVLEKTGYSVLTASDSATAMELFASSTIRLVLVDDCLRDGTGIELAKAMKKLKPDVLIAIISALAEAPAGMEHADLFISKTESTAQVLQKISELLSGCSDSRRRA
jgi:DNA-binding response OmpR family regulator